MAPATHAMPALERLAWILTLLVLAVIGVRLSKKALRGSSAIKTLDESEEALDIITRGAKDAIIMMDGQGKISFWNPAAEEIFGYAAHEVIGAPLHELLAPQRYHKLVGEGCHAFQGTGAGVIVGKTIELVALKKDGTEFPVELSLSALQMKGTWIAVGILRDIAERKKAEVDLQAQRAKLEELVQERTEELTAVNELLHKEILDRTRTEEELFRSETFLNTIFDSFRDPFNIVDHEYRIVKFNEAYTRIRDKRASDLYGKKCYEAFHQRDAICPDCVIQKTFQSGDPCAKEKMLKVKDGAQVWVEIYTYPIFDQDKKVTHVVEYSRDITARKKTEEENKQLIQNLNHLSTTDMLTGLANRRALNEMLNHEIERAIRYSTDLSLIICDVDKFKIINDTYGHLAGDRALQLIAEGLKRTLRRSDVVGRYGGDEFMIIMPETSLAGAQSLAEKVRSAINELELELKDGERMNLSLSMGVSSCCAASENLDTLIALADAALYESKQGGRNKVSAAKA